MSVLVFLSSAESFGEKPVQNGGNGWSHGYIIGRPYRISYRGVIINSPEARIQTGEFIDDPRYIGESVEFSVGWDRKDLIQKFERLDSNRNYIFRYYRHAPLDIVLKYGNRAFLTDIIEIQSNGISGLIPEGSSEVSKLIKQEPTSNRVRHGTYSTGERNGRIISVERWGGSTVCEIGLNFGGVNKQSSGVSHFQHFATYSEEVCSFAEKVLSLQKTVSLDYSQDFIEFWDDQEKIIHKLKILAVDSDENSSFKSNPSTTKQNYEDFKQKILTDPKFLKELKEKLEASK